MIPEPSAPPLPDAALAREERWASLLPLLPPDLRAFADEMTALLQRLREQEAALAATKAELQAHASRTSNIVRLDVGGIKFATTRSNLERLEGSYLASMLSWPPNEAGEYFLDVSPTHFGRVMDFVRSGDLCFDGLRGKELADFNELLDYLQLAPQEPTPSPTTAITLNVGGTKFATARENLLRFPNSVFASLLGNPVNEHGEYFLDADPTHFGRVMKVLRAEKCNFDGLSETDIADLRGTFEMLRVPAPLPVKFDHKHCSNKLALSKGDMVVVKTNFSFDPCSVLTTMPLHRFTVKFDARNIVDVGFTTVSLFQLSTAKKTAPTGWYLQCPSGYLQAPSPTPPATSRMPRGSDTGVAIVTATYDECTGRVIFEVNGSTVGVLTNIPRNIELFPMVRLYNEKSQVFLVDPTS
ncbi:hypothetical protein ACHHYP_14633 [Achlya hypogyna]|uniref:Potassium channel tetramerisation-type BTB domain-containing protein n=1 Tax=Achlya hypogyna TaxID=1202772 RepID=A0A1V9YCL3_ACHHY|nr:hypothetical protein ACHHYP_14633 [Achlya hypogyna]